MKKTTTNKTPLTPFQKKKKRRKIVNFIMGLIIFCGLLGCVSGVSIIKLALEKCDVVLNPSDLGSTDSSLIFDDKGDLIQTIGKESRISYPYSKMPQVVIDAFVAVEDSRYFEHQGFDIPRFAKALIENIKTLSFAQGGSTLTMQVVKNTYFAVDTIADKSVGRKIQEIYYSLQINKVVPKEKIIEIYINKVNYGSSARGIQVAAQYYFGKDTTELNLVEAAMLAGIVNAPNENNPYYHLENCQKRTKTVLYQMLNHGYITKEEYDVAVNVKIENLLVGSTTTTFGSGETAPYQAYIDVVLSELSELYNIDPYTTPVKIYTSMNKTVQEYCDELARGNVVKFQDEYINTSVVLIQNRTGRIVGLCGGRDYDGVKLFNYAYDNRVNPGSTSKGVFTYPLAFEHAGVGTNWYAEDVPMVWTGSKKVISEDHGYYGWTSLQRAFTTSYNIVAVKLFRMVNQAVGKDYMADYLKSVGIDEKVANGINEQYGIGEQNFLASPIQLAAMESVILSGGVYTAPHTITRIEFINSTNDPIIAEPRSEQVLSQGAAWLTSYLQEVSVSGNSSADDWMVNGRLKTIKNSNYTVYGKTGTSLYDADVRKKYGMPTGAIKDWLMVGGTNDYSFSFWMGYDTGQYISKNTYVNKTTTLARTDGKIVNGLLAAAEKAFGKPKNSNNKPSSVVQISHLKTVFPYMAAPSYADPSLVVKSYILKQYANVEAFSPLTTEIASIQSFNAAYDSSHKSLICNWSTYPDSTKTQLAPEKYEYEYLNKKYKDLVRVFDSTWLDGYVQYQVSIKNNETGKTTYLAADSDSASFPLENNTEHAVTYTITGWYQYTKVDIRSNSISTTVTVPGKAVDPIVPTDPVTPPDTDITE